MITVVPYRHWRGWLETQQREPAQQTKDNEATLKRLEHIIRLSESAARNHLRPMNCLRRTFTQQKILRRRHLPSTVHIGVRSGESALEAHSWLCWQGRVLNDAPDVSEHYAEMQAEQWASIGGFSD